MVAFLVGSEDPDALRKSEEYYRELEGLLQIAKQTDHLWLLVFRDKESANAAQWQLDINGARRT